MRREGRLVAPSRRTLRRGLFLEPFIVKSDSGRIPSGTMGVVSRVVSVDNVWSRCGDGRCSPCFGEEFRRTISRLPARCAPHTRFPSASRNNR